MTASGPTFKLVAEGVPGGTRFILEPCGDVIDATQVQLRPVDDAVHLFFRRM